MTESVGRTSVGLNLEVDSRGRKGSRREAEDGRLDRTERAMIIVPQRNMMPCTRILSTGGTPQSG